MMTDETATPETTDLTQDKYVRLAWFADFLGLEGQATWFLRNREDGITLEDVRQMPIALTADDIFESFQSDSGESRCLAEFREFWNNFDRVFDALVDNNQEVGVALFERKVSDTQNLLDYGLNSYKTNLIFNARQWVGREKDLVSMYHLLSDAQKNAINLLSTRKEIAELEDRSFRPEKIESALMQFDSNLKETAYSADLEKYEKALNLLGLRPNPDDIFFPNTDDGDSYFTGPAHYANIGKWIEYFREQGCDFDVTELNRRYGQKETLLKKAANSDMKHLFNPKLWVGHLDDMLKLWSVTPETYRQDFDFVGHYADAEEDTYQFPYPIDDNLTKDMVLGPVNAEQGGDYQNFLAAGTQGFWQNFDAIQDILESKGTPITLEDLYQPNGASGNSLMTMAVRNGALYEVLSLVNPSQGVYLDLEKCSAKSKTDLSFIDAVSDSYQLDELFDPSLWKDNPFGMNAFWEATPEGTAKECVDDFPQRLGQVNRERLLNAHHHLRRQASLRP